MPKHQSCRSESDQPPGAAARGGRGRFRVVAGRDGRSPSRRRTLSRVKVGCPSSLRLRSPTRDRSGRSHDQPCLGSLPDPGARQAEAWVLLPSRPAEARRRPKPPEGMSINQRGQARTGIRTNRIGATTWVTRLSDKVDSVSGSQRPSMPPTRAGACRTLTRRPHATSGSCWDGGCRLPAFTRKGGEAEGDPDRARPPGGERAKVKSLWSLFFGARRTPERRALLRAHAAG